LIAWPLGTRQRRVKCSIKTCDPIAGNERKTGSRLRAQSSGEIDDFVAGLNSRALPEPAGECRISSTLIERLRPSRIKIDDRAIHLPIHFCRTPVSEEEKKLEDGQLGSTERFFDDETLRVATSLVGILSIVH
jgi:hypothetical protein